MSRYKEAKWEVCSIPMSLVLAAECDHDDSELCNIHRVHFFPYGIMGESEALITALGAMLSGEPPEPKPQTMLIAAPATTQRLGVTWAWVVDSDLREGFESVYPLGFDACVAYWETLRDQFPTSTMEVDEALMSKGRVRQ